MKHNIYIEGVCDSGDLVSLSRSIWTEETHAGPSSILHRAVISVLFNYFVTHIYK